MTDIFKYLSERPYPGRGIMLGATPSGKSVCAYFIMGRSENSRNRVFEKTEDGIRTRAWDESRMTDPSLIIYHPVRRVGRGLVVTNGDQTDTVRDHILAGATFAAALRTREFEPDGPNWTPRISGLLSPVFALTDRLSGLWALPPELLRGFLLGLLEMTRGCLELGRTASPLAPVMAAFLISFGGVSINMQALSFLKKCNIKARTFFFRKTVHAFLSALLAIPLFLLL